MLSAMETDADTEFMVQDGRTLRRVKGKIRSLEGGVFHTQKKLKDLGLSHPNKKQEVVNEPPQNFVQPNKKPGWEKVQWRKNERKERKKQPPEKPPVPQPKPNQKKPRKAVMRSEALIIRPTDKDKYSDILRRIKTAAPVDQVCHTVEKIRNTAAGDMLITMSKGSADKGKALHKTISEILQDDAKVINTGLEEDLEIRDIDDTTTTGDILAALQKVAENDCGITAEAIKIRKAFRGTQTASVTLAAATAQKVVRQYDKIRIGWVNCRIRTVLRLVRCYKCWHFRHRAVQYQSKKDRSKHCIKCGEEGHKLTKYNKPARCALSADHSGIENVAYHASSNRCPVYQEALKKITNSRK
ncbi:Uncharacterized 50 kDa protein in type I retrotransposable element R1DM [Eumeta japonica]|uniref:Uncharacterized 50 kDa protein in type I retrotransposable element R1DM n=1 Tax=Eumeta variegata TaxID=151549 RepID=A0A4C1YRW2_EUMVA|nr:Uncharacterized 50 kDa protein in type I retrotransposable element R1DM [Eumeta japonica]